MIFDSWIDREDETVDRDCAFCGRMAVCTLVFGALNVHLCEAHVEPQEKAS